jgi:hypothetical protein
MHHQLRSIAQAQNRNPQFKQLPAAGCCPLLIAAVGASCQNNSLGIHSLDLTNVCLVGVNFTIYAALTDTAGHKLVILAAEVDHNDLFSIHKYPS